jgi:hypothetical protein
MSTTLKALIVGLFVSAAVATGTMQGCGGSSGSGGDIALCEQVCDKSFSCVPDAGSAEMQAATLCKQECASRVAMSQTCSNHSAIAAALRSCVAMDCAGYSACLLNLPAPTGCQTGTGGTTGAGGMGGGGGGAAGGDCSICTKADQCCAALDPTADCVLAQTCTGATGQTQTTVIMGCQTLLTSLGMNPSAPAACR